MLDDVLEIALELGGEVLEAVIEHRWKRRKARRRAKKVLRAQKAEEKRMAVQQKEDPWRVRKPKLPWEG